MPANDEEALAESAAPEASKKAERKMMAPPSPALASSAQGGAFAPQANAFDGAAALDTAQSDKAGDQFQFTVKKPVSLERGRSAMLPLVAGEIAAERVSIFTPGSGSRHPMLGAKLSNSTGIRLPAGPIAVFDGGVYAGDALLDFFAEKDARIVVFGEDLGVSTDVSASSSQETVGAKTYAFKNGTSDEKKIVVEHPISPGAELVEPKASDEKTESVYRFSLPLSAGGEAKLIVKERSPRRQSIVLASLGAEDFLSYSASREIPQAVRDALKKAIDLKKKTEDAKRALAGYQERKESLAADQSRYRDNIDTVGRDSSQGQQYLKKLMEAEAAIDQANAKIESAQKGAQEAQAAYEAYIGSLSL